MSRTNSPSRCVPEDDFMTLATSCRVSLRGAVFAAWRERVLYWQLTGPNPPNHRDDFSRPALRHGSLNSIFRVASYLQSWKVPRLPPSDHLICTGGRWNPTICGKKSGVSTNRIRAVAVRTPVLATCGVSKSSLSVSFICRQLEPGNEPLWSGLEKNNQRTKADL